MLQTAAGWKVGLYISSNLVFKRVRDAADLLETRRTRCEVP
jgi:hypothetical protein